MYLRTIEQALEAMAEVLDLRDRRDRLVQSTVQIMLCLETEPRTLLVDVQALLLQGGLEALRRRRLRALPGALPLVAASEGARLLESVAAALDALRFARAVRQVLPGLRHERWQVARALLVNEGGVAKYLEEAIRARQDPAARSASEDAVREMILSLHQPWMDRAGSMRSACLEALRAGAPSEPDRLHPEAELLFELFAASDARAADLLAAIDRSPGEAERLVLRIRESADAARSLEPGLPHEPPGRAGLQGVA